MIEVRTGKCLTVHIHSVALTLVVKFFAVVHMALGLLSACSQDNAIAGGDESQAVNFTSPAYGAAFPSLRSVGSDQAFSGITHMGMPYLDYIDENGHTARRYFPETDGSVLQNATGIPATRTAADGDSWIETDAVGIFMVSAGGELQGDILTVSGTTADNVQYRVIPDGFDSSSATFVPANAGETIYYPQSDNVDFVAYYPHGMAGTGTGEVNNYVYNINVAGQTNETTQNALDVLYAKTTDVAKNNTVSLTFSHVMSKMTLNIRAEESISNTDISELEASAVVFGGMPVEAGLDLQDGTLTAMTTGDFSPLKATTSTYDATFTAIVVAQPQDNGTTSGGLPNFSNRTVVFTVGGQPYTWDIPDAFSFMPGNHYVYMVTVSKTGITVSAASITKWNVNNGDVSTAQQLDVVKIPAGTFLMGSSDGSNIGNSDGSGLNISPAEPDRYANEIQHLVTLTQAFYMSKYQITNVQYVAFLNTKEVSYETDITSGLTSGEGGICTWGDNAGQVMIFTHIWGVTHDGTSWVAQRGYENHPVINVTWFGAYEYAVWVGGALPTEAQWEHACRAGKDNFPFGVGTGYELNNTHATFDWRSSWVWDGNSAEASVTNTGSYIGATQQAGSFASNPWGLYDMHGNVWEWCADWSGNYVRTHAVDPVGQASSIYRVARGGTWNRGAADCRSAVRGANSPTNAYSTFGFRVVFVP